MCEAKGSSNQNKVASSNNNKSRSKCEANNKHNEGNKDKWQEKTNTPIFVHLVRVNLSYFPRRKKNSPIHYKIIDTKRLQEIRSQAHKEIILIFYLIFKPLKSTMIHK